MIAKGETCGAGDSSWYLLLALLFTLARVEPMWGSREGGGWIVNEMSGGAFHLERCVPKWVRKEGRKE